MTDTQNLNNVWYFYDATITGDPRSVCVDITRCSCMLADIGLFLNPSKSEIVNLGLDETVFIRETQCMNYILENVSFVEREDVILHGSPLISTAIRPQFQHKLSIFKAMTEKLSLLDRHPAYFLLKNCFSMPKLMYLLRSSPTFQSSDLLPIFLMTASSLVPQISAMFNLMILAGFRQPSPLDWAA